MKHPLIISSIVIFALIIMGAIITVFTILKHENDSKSLPSNPAKAIQVICSMVYVPQSCISSISQYLYGNVSSSKKISPRKIYSFSLHSALSELKILTSLTEELTSNFSNFDPWIESKWKDCENVFRNSLFSMNKTYMEMGFASEDAISIPETEIRRRHLRKKTVILIASLQHCHRSLDDTGDIWDAAEELRRKMYLTEVYATNSFGILRKMDVIFELFYPSIESSDYVGSLVLTYEFVLSLCVICLQAVVVVFLLCLIVRYY